MGYTNNKNFKSSYKNKNKPSSVLTPKADKMLKKVFNKIGTPSNTEFIPDDFQLEAIKKVKKTDVIVSAPTGSGKTYIAIEAIKDILKSDKKVWYTTPLKALSNSKYHEFSKLFGDENVGIVTGDRKENTDAKVIVGTTEILRNQLYDAMSEGKNLDTDLVVLDEAHYLADKDRGVVWEEVIIYLPERIRLLLLSATIPNAGEISAWITSLRNEKCVVIESEIRPVPLFPLYLLPDGELVPLREGKGINKKIYKFLNTKGKSRFKGKSGEIDYLNILKVLEKYDLLPAVFFLKSRMDCNNALKLCSKRLINSDRKEDLKVKTDKFLDDYPFLSKHPNLKHIKNNALGSHHGGHLPHWKFVVESLMNRGLLDAIFSTSTVAAGVNFPARTVVLMQSDRFNGSEFADLTPSDLHQTVGRAGRRGKDKIGFALMPHGRFQDPHLINKLFSKPADPVESQVKIDFSMCLNLLYSLSPDNIYDLLIKTFLNFQRSDHIKELEHNYSKVFTAFSSKIKDTLCSDPEQVIKRINDMSYNTKKLSRYRKRKSKIVRGQAKTVSAEEPKIKLLKIEKSIAHYEKLLNELPCSKCINYDICHHDKSHYFYSQAKTVHTKKESYESVKNQVWNEFNKYLDFLVLTGFADNKGKLSKDGIWASKLRLDQPLIIAELIRKGFLEKLSPELLCAMVSIFVNDRYRDITVDPSFTFDHKLLSNAFLEMMETVKDIMTLMEKYRFNIPEIQYWSAVVLFAWANGKSWDKIISLTTVDEGDLAMLIFRTADNLRQIISLADTHPELAKKARKSIDLILKEPVIIPF
jgi:superfamily II RNA helicase